MKSLPGATTSEAATGATAPPRERAARESASGRGELIAKIGTVLSAILASSCCWLPVLLLVMGVSGAGIASTLEAYRPLFMTVTFAFLATAFYFTYRPRRVATAGGDCCSAPVTIAGTGIKADCCAPQPVHATADKASGRSRFNMMAMNKVMLWGVTALAVVMLFFPALITDLLGRGAEKVTADMTRSEVRIEGMTCEG